MAIERVAYHCLSTIILVLSWHFLSTHWLQLEVAAQVNDAKKGFNFSVGSLVFQQGKPLDAPEKS